MRSLVRKSIPFAIGALFLIIIGCGIYKKSEAGDCSSDLRSDRLLSQGQGRLGFVIEGQFCRNVKRGESEQAARIFALALSFWIQALGAKFSLSLRVCADCLMDAGGGDCRRGDRPPSVRRRPWGVFGGRIGDVASFSPIRV